MKRAFKITAISVAVIIVIPIALTVYVYGDFIWRAWGDLIVAGTVVALAVGRIFWRFRRWEKQ